MKPIRALAATAVAAALVATACEPPASDAGKDPSAPVTQAIVNGKTETGWPAVGALTLQYPGNGYVGSFCSATLITPQWVLTAAHCLVEHEGMEVKPSLTKFLVGSNANPTGWGGGPINGTLYATDAFYIHPNYNPNANYDQNDIGLVHLAKPITGVSPIPINTSAFTGSWIGDIVTYVGFGVTDGINQGGSGVKRLATMAIAQYYPLEYYSEYNGQGICFGDSGGPGLMQVNGTWKVVGVNSAVGGGQADPCKGTYIDTRADAYATWISGKTNQPLPSCKSNPGMCFCPSACGTNGVCDNTKCQTKDCQQTYDCLLGCNQTDQGCQIDCYQSATADGQTKLDAIFGCAQTKCGTVPDSQYQTCMQNNCSAQIDACFPVPTGNATCEQVWDCLTGCPQSDQTCAYDCYGTGTKTAQGQLDALLTCFDDKCGTITDQSAYSECVYSKCATQLNTCMPPANCPVAGGGCKAGEACYPASGGATDCYPSNGKKLGEACNASLASSLDCGDGLICLNATAFTYTCQKLCTSDGHCAVDEACQKPIFQNVTDIGVCDCIDGDGDGVCKVDDCNDSAPGVSPKKKEACGNGQDDDCDGQIDEDCSCTDGDKDGYCKEDDCDDADAARNPGAAEKCGNGQDDDCDGEAEEGCDTCVDEDGDGYCKPEDCVDADPNVNPGAAEVCDNGRDDDCNGSKDDGCAGGCTDWDQDGVCVPDDCNDGDAAVKPGATEICGNDADDDCDGAKDEGCEGGGGGGTGGEGGGTGGEGGGTGGEVGGEGGGEGGGTGGEGTGGEGSGGEGSGGEGSGSGGNGGEPGNAGGQPVYIDNGAGASGGCSAGGGTSPAFPALLLGLVALARFTRRRRV